MGPSLNDLPEQRQGALDRRSRLTTKRRLRLDEKRYRVLDDSGLIDGAQVIGAYAAVSDEPDPLPWRHIADGHRVALPRVDRETLVFGLVDSLADLAPGKWGILEPLADLPVELLDLDAILVPLLLFDATCARAGRGAGFYDRALRPVVSRQNQRRPVLIGIADDEDLTKGLPQHDGDVSLDAVVTPSKVLHRA